MRARYAIAVLALVLTTPGCLVAAVAGATYGVIKYERNEAYTDFDEDFETVWTATLRAVREEGYPVALDVGHAKSEGSFEVQDAQVTVDTDRGFTRVRIRIGTFETKESLERAEAILRRTEQLVYDSRH